MAKLRTMYETPSLSPYLTSGLDDNLRELRHGSSYGFNFRAPNSHTKDSRNFAVIGLSKVHHTTPHLTLTVYVSMGLFPPLSLAMISITARAPTLHE